MKKNICIIGAGNIGSRHLQALKKVSIPLKIQVIDPSFESLLTAKERYELFKPKNAKHDINFYDDIKKVTGNIDIAIIATNSNVREKIIEELLSITNVTCFIFEKLLFQNYQDYGKIGDLLRRKKIKAWVNCNMRSMPFYNNKIKVKLNKKPIQYSVSGGQYGLVTNAIHYIDHIAYLTNCYDFKVDTNSLKTKPINSKRKGFLELNGTLNLKFKDGSLASFTCYSKGSSPVIVQIFSENFRLISKETERKAWISDLSSDWKWKEVEANIPYQSELTNILVSDILKSGECNLTPYQNSVKLHITLLENLLKFLNNNSENKYSYYPFT